MSINNKDIFDEIERKLNKYFSDPKKNKYICEKREWFV